MTEFFKKIPNWGKLLLLIILCLGLTHCANFRAYYNAYFNGDKAFTKAKKLQAERFKKNPLDTVAVTPDERTLYKRAIEKASKVLELYHKTPNKYLAMSLFMIGESYFEIADYENAVKKYEELEHSYPNFEKLYIAKFHKSKCLYLSAPYHIAKKALINIIATTTDEQYKYEAMKYYAELEKKNNSKYSGLEIYEQLLGEKKLTPVLRGQILFEAAQLAYDIGEWNKVLKLTQEPDIKLLQVPVQFLAEMLYVKSLYQLEFADSAIQHLKSIVYQNKYKEFESKISLQMGIWLLDGKTKELKFDEGIELLKDVTKLAPKSETSAQAYYHIAKHFLDKLHNEKKALEYFILSNGEGAAFEFAIKSKEKQDALEQLLMYRAKTDSSDSLSHAEKDFKMAEIFLFNFDNFDSAVAHLDSIADNNKTDSVFSIKAAYARAYIYDTFSKDVNDKEKSKAFYLDLIEKFPNTDYAKQAEKNLGRVSTIKTEEDLAHSIYLEAEELLYSGFDLKNVVIPKFSEVISKYPNTQAAAQAQFVIAMQYESEYFRGDTSSYFKAGEAHFKVRNNYKESPYFSLSNIKLINAGNREGDSLKLSLPTDTTLPRLIKRSDSNYDGEDGRDNYDDDYNDEKPSDEDSQEKIDETDQWKEDEVVPEVLDKGEVDSEY